MTKMMDGVTMKKNPHMNVIEALMRKMKWDIVMMT